MSQHNMRHGSVPLMFQHGMRHGPVPLMFQHGMRHGPVPCFHKQGTYPCFLYASTTLTRRRLRCFYLQLPAATVTESYDAIRKFGFYFSSAVMLQFGASNFKSGAFIGNDMRLDLVKFSDEESMQEIMSFYMGDNTMECQNSICNNLRSEEELEGIDIWENMSCLR